MEKGVGILSLDEAHAAEADKGNRIFDHTGTSHTNLHGKTHKNAPKANTEAEGRKKQNERTEEEMVVGL